MQSNEIPDELVSATMPAAGMPKRPKRLVIITIMNVVLALFSIVALVFLLNSSHVPAQLVPRGWNAAFSTAVALALIVSSVLALMGFPRARWIALIIALTFFGLIWIHSLLAALDPEGVIGAVPTDRESRKLWAGVVRTSIEIGLNLWVFLSAKTKAFFDSRRAEA
jgi:amino acid transporter